MQYKANLRLHEQGIAPVKLLIDEYVELVSETLWPLEALAQDMYNNESCGFSLCLAVLQVEAEQLESVEPRVLVVK